MSWSIGLHLGESVFEIAARNDAVEGAPVFKHRAFLSHGAPELVLRQFAETRGISHAAKALVATSLPRRIIDSAHGSPAAILTTAGFENWLELSLPMRTAFFTARPKRVPFLMDRELVFGVSERVNAQGQLEKVVADTELEFLVSKLQLHEIKNVAVGFLHSNLNPANEKRVRDYLSEKGFKVFLSSDQNAACDEKARFLTAALNAYITPLYVEKLQALHNELTKLVTDSRTIRIGDFALEDVLSGAAAPLETGFSLGNHLGSRFAQTTALLYCGLEEILLFKPARERTPIWQSPVGPISAPNWPFVKTTLQPLTKLARGFFSELSYTRDKISYDPGPVIFGRGLVPCLLDILAQDTTFAGTLGLAEKISEKGQARLAETFSAYARNHAEGRGVDAQALVAYLREIATLNLKNELGGEKALLLCGPLAPALRKWLGGEVIGDEFFAVTSLLMGEAS